MADKTGSSAKTVIIGLIVVAGLGAGGYLGFKTLKEEMFRTQTVVIDLNAETIKEIRASTAKTVVEVRKLSGELVDAEGKPAPSASPKLNADLTELKQGLAAIQSKQQAIISQLGALKPPSIGVVSPATKSAEPARAPEMKIVTKLVRPYRQTIYFPLNRVMAAKVDEQIKNAINALKDEAGARTCTVTVFGFSDSLGNDASNLQLSQRRAEYVSRKLQFEDLNVADVRGWGERRLEVLTLDGAQNDRNRRVEIDLHCDVNATDDTKPPMPKKAPVS